MTIPEWRYAFLEYNMISDMIKDAQHNHVKTHSFAYKLFHAPGVRKRSQSSIGFYMNDIGQEIENQVEKINSFFAKELQKLKAQHLVLMDQQKTMVSTFTKSNNL